jgi:hypothetical protein
LPPAKAWTPSVSMLGLDQVKRRVDAAVVAASSNE